MGRKSHKSDKTLTLLSVVSLHKTPVLLFVVSLDKILALSSVVSLTRIENGYFFFPKSDVFMVRLFRQY